MRQELEEILGKHRTGYLGNGVFSDELIQDLLRWKDPKYWCEDITIDYGRDYKYIEPDGTERNPREFNFCPICGTKRPE